MPAGNASTGSVPRVTCMTRACATPATGGCRVGWQAMPDDLEIRPVQPAEYDAAGAVTALAFQEFSPGKSPLWHEYLTRIADVAGRSSRTTVLVAVVDGVIAGSATLELEERIPRATDPSNRTRRISECSASPRASRTRDRATPRRRRASNRAGAAARPADPRHGAGDDRRAAPVRRLGFTPTAEADARTGSSSRASPRHRRRHEALGSSGARRLREGREGTSRHQALRAAVRDRGRADDSPACRGARGERAHRAALRRHAARQRRHRRRGDRRPVAHRQAQPACRRCSSTTTRRRCCSWRSASCSRCGPSRIRRSSARSPICRAR